MIDKNMLAMDALSKLARQFSDRPDLHQLVEMILLTLAGQFSVTSSFAVLFNKNSSKKPLYFGIGKYNANLFGSAIELSDKSKQSLVAMKEPVAFESLSADDLDPNFQYILQESNVSVIAPLIHNNELICLLVLGNKINKKPFEAEDMNRLYTIISSITPFVVNSYHFLEIAELNKWYLSILNSVKQGVFVFNHDDNLLAVNQAGLDILKSFKPNISSVDSILNIPLKMIFNEGIFSGWSKKIINAKLDHTTPHVMLKNQVASFKGVEFVYNVRWSRISRTTDGEEDYIITLDDITNQKASEQRLFELEKFADQGVMAASIAHELNNFLGMILGGVEIAELSAKKGKMEKAIATFEKIKNNISKMERFTKGLTDYSRTESEKAEHNLNVIISDVLSFVSVQKRFLNIHCHTELDKNLPRHSMNSDHIAQLLLNFFYNAADAIKEAERAKGEILVKTKLEDDNILMVISDNGIGIKKELKEKLFRVHFTTKQSGHGYGLVTCARILNEHNVELNIESDVGKGTSFYLRFPIKETVPATPVTA